MLVSLEIRLSSTGEKLADETRDPDEVVEPAVIPRATRQEVFRVPPLTEGGQGLETVM